MLFLNRSDIQPVTRCVLLEKQVRKDVMNLIVVGSLASLLVCLAIGIGNLLVFLYVKFQIDYLMHHLALQM